MNPIEKKTRRPDRRMPWPEPGSLPVAHPASEPLLTREWLITNGLGGYAAGTLSGVSTRRYHGLLVAALPTPHGRVLMLGQVREVLHLPDGTRADLGGEHRAGREPEAPGAGYLREFRLEAGLPVWTYAVGDSVLEKRVFLLHLQNTVHVVYRLLEGPGTARLEMHPTVHVRPHDAPVNTDLGCPYKITAVEGQFEICSCWPELPPLRMALDGANPAFTVAGRRIEGVYYGIEDRRGYESLGELWSPGFFAADLVPDGEMTAALVGSTEDWPAIQALSHAEALAAELQRRERLIYNADRQAHAGTAAELVLAADAFVVTPSRAEDEARAHAAGDEARSVIAGYHWFTDWGRDTMISLEGLTLTTGRGLEAGYILRTFARHVRDGLIPNLFLEGDQEGLYHTADATFWFFHALDRYLDTTGDRQTLALLLPTLMDIVDHHLRGTRFGIGVDPDDGLLRQGAEGYQLTWMDAKVDDWVVTPRRGKAVEINALWYNALRLLERWLREENGEQDKVAQRVGQQAERARDSFNRRFWYEAGGHLYDVIDGPEGDDPACRPNQVFAISLPHPILDRARWEPVMKVVENRLLTPVGLRSLAPGHPAYRPSYDGDLRNRDAAYHQGTVWGWLIGPFVDAWLKLHPGDPTRARQFLEGLLPHLGEACLGTISEIFDAEPPFTPRGCVAQAWSVAEVLRCWVKTAGPVEAEQGEAVEVEEMPEERVAV